MTIQEQIVAARVAQAAIKDYTQEQIDKLVYEVAKIIYKNAEPLAREAVDETRLGCYEDKIAKNTDTPATFWAYLKDKKSVGIISEDAVSGVMEIAHPIGVIGAITPATNPTVTPLGNFMHALKGKNALVVCPAPRAQKTSTHTIELMREALVANGAPADLVQAVEEPTLEHSAQLMAECDLVLATGAFGLTKAAYSSGTPAYGVGPGNPPVVLDRGYDLTDAVKMTITAVGSDNGILCDGDNMLLHPAEEEKALFDTMRREGVVVFDKPEDVDKFREVLFVNGKSNPALVGKDAPVIAKAAGFDIPETTKVIALKVSAVGSADILNKEIMGPVVVTKGYDTFEDAVGYGHPEHDRVLAASATPPASSPTTRSTSATTASGFPWPVSW